MRVRGNKSNRSGEHRGRNGKICSSDETKGYGYDPAEKHLREASVSAALMPQYNGAGPPLATIERTILISNNHLRPAVDSPLSVLGTTPGIYVDHIDRLVASCTNVRHKSLLVPSWLKANPPKDPSTGSRGRESLGLD